MMKNVIGFPLLTMEYDSSEDEDIEIAYLLVALVNKRKKRKHRIWVREIFQDRDTRIGRSTAGQIEVAPGKRYDWSREIK